MGARTRREVRGGVVAWKSGNADGAKDRQEGRDGMDATKEAQPAAVPEGAMQAGELRARWAWVESSVWTDRMLEALEKGVKGGKGFGPMPTSLTAGFSHWSKPTPWRSSPLDGKTPNRRAGCGRPACPVRREGCPKGHPYPYVRL